MYYARHVYSTFQWHYKGVTFESQVALLYSLFDSLPQENVNNKVVITFCALYIIFMINR